MESRKNADGAGGGDDDDDDGDDDDGGDDVANSWIALFLKREKVNDRKNRKYIHFNSQLIKY